MFGPSGFIIIGLALATALALLLILAFGSFPGMIRTVRREFWCPVAGGHVVAEFQEEAWDGRRVEVDRCSAFTPPTAITCKKLCLTLKKLPSAGARAA